MGIQNWIQRFIALERKYERLLRLYLDKREEVVSLRQQLAAATRS